MYMGISHYYSFAFEVYFDGSNALQNKSNNCNYTVLIF